MKNGIVEYDLFKKNLLKTVKVKGVLVKKMNKSDNFLLDASTQAKLYKTSLGAVEKYGFLHKKIKHVYVVYEDFDNTIKYYDYPQ
ncbi:hypothetical protein SAMN05443270_3468 [Lacrimispora sphenoides]|uniref:hypothetical protein n=1 Tax=Lacrimispora sphenoides TaxID=29370 RepID=UPI0008C2AB15|nr:hypothetical protein [Lacrimispora sphenoides]SEU22310.1 hypothetical protein SAMN05443270_3468 [Lacrimispora sphenoides]